LQLGGGLPLHKHDRPHISIPHVGTKNWLAGPVLLVTAWR
jgi:hypothetical protein